MRARQAGAALSMAVAAVCVAGCGGSASTQRVGAVGDAADAAFLQEMIPHHMQAIAAGALAASDGTDPRVRAFGQRIVREQTPELQRMQAAVAALGLHLDETAGAAMAVNRITPARLSAIRAEPAAERDHDLIADSAASEQGAVQMAAPEVAHGAYAPAVSIAKSISGAPYSEIPELQRLAAQLPG